MLTVALHLGQPLQPHDLWRAWNLDPLVVGGLILVGWAYRRGRRRGPGRDLDRRRERYFVAALIAVAVAFISPLDAASGSLASAHMIQHLLLVVVAAPLMASASPGSALIRSGSVAFRRGVTAWRRRLRLTRRSLVVLRNPGLVWLLHVVTVWFWHAAGPYEAALSSDALHAVEHLSFLITGFLFWRVVVGLPANVRVSGGYGVILVFAMSLQGVFLAALLTFATSPWYPTYTTSTQGWGVSPLDDQRLAGLVMWGPAGLVYVGVALALMLDWVRGDPEDTHPGGRSRI
jgi:cytochrome c oxidase assembly factor CtaG